MWNDILEYKNIEHLNMKIISLSLLQYYLLFIYYIYKDMNYILKSKQK